MLDIREAVEPPRVTDMLLKLDDDDLATINEYLADFREKAKGEGTIQDSYKLREAQARFLCATGKVDQGLELFRQTAWASVTARWSRATSSSSHPRFPGRAWAWTLTMGIPALSTTARRWAASRVSQRSSIMSSRPSNPAAAARCATRASP